MKKKVLAAVILLAVAAAVLCLVLLRPGSTPAGVKILVDGEERQEFFDSTLLTRWDKGAEGLPMEFFISVKAAKQDPFSASAQNELILQLLQSGAIDAKRAVKHMTFEGKDQLLKEMTDDTISKD